MQRKAVIFRSGDRLSEVCKRQIPWQYITFFTISIFCHKQRNRGPLRRSKSFLSASSPPLLHSSGVTWFHSVRSLGGGKLEVSVVSVHE
jgi:hypothetical protein